MKRGVLLAAHTGSLVAFTRILPPLQSQHINRTRNPLYLLGSRSGTSNRERKDGASPLILNRNRLRVPSRVNDNDCVQSVAGLKDSAYVTGKLQGLNPSPVIAGGKDLTSKSKTVNSHVNSCVANVHSVTRLPQKKGLIPFYCQNYTEIKYVKDVSCVGHLSSINCVTNVPTIVLDLPVGARLHQFWEKWAALGASPEVVTVLREGYTLPFQFRPNLTRSSTVTSNYVNLHLESLQQLVNKNAVEPVATQKSLAFYNKLFWYTNPTIGGDLSFT